MKTCHTITSQIAVAVLALAWATTALAAPDTTPRLENPGFENPTVTADSPGTLPEKWFYFSSTTNSTAGLTTRKKRSGTQSMFFKSQSVTDAYHGIAQKFPVTPGIRYEFTVYACNDATDPITGDAYGQVSIEWQDSAGTELSRTHGPTWNFELSPLRWQSFMVGDTAPEGAAVGVAVVTFFSRNSNGAGRFYIDDLKISAIPLK